MYAGVVILSAALVSETNPVRQYVSDNLNGFMTAQKEKLGLEYTGSPDIHFLHAPDRFAEYDSATDTIILNDLYLAVPSDNEKRQRNMETHGSDLSLDYVLNHELFHFYSDKIREKEKLDSAEIIYDTVVDEGIATVVGHIMSERQTHCSLPEGLEPHILNYVFDKTFRYEVGTCIANPVVREFGKRGILHLIRNPPRDEELESPFKYRDRIMQELRE